MDDITQDIPQDAIDRVAHEALRSIPCRDIEMEHFAEAVVLDGQADKALADGDVEKARLKSYEEDFELDAIDDDLCPECREPKGTNADECDECDAHLRDLEDDREFDARREQIITEGEDA